MIAHRARKFHVAHLQEHNVTKRILKRYNVVTKDQLVPGLLKQLDIETEREFLAAVDFLVCSQAQTFLGKHGFPRTCVLL
jgi:hypothetical protein